MPRCAPPKPLLLTLLTLLPFLAGSVSLRAQEPARDTRPGIAVLRFENGGSLGPAAEDFGALEVGIQQMLLSELAQNPELRIVERTALRELLAEQGLAVERRVDPATAARTGQLVAARYVVTGSFVDVSNTFRIDARVVDVESGEVLRSADVSDDRARMYPLIVDLAGRVFEGVDLPPLPDETVEERKLREIPPEAITLYAWGQVFEDRGYPDLASAAYSQVIDAYPDMTEAREAWASLIGRWELNAFLGSFNDEPEFDLRQPRGDDFRRDALLGLRVGYRLPRRFFVEGEVGNALVRLSAGPTEGRNVNAFLFGGSLGYQLRPRHDLEVFGLAGLGGVRWGVKNLPAETQLAVHYGLGTRVFLTREHAVRFDARMHQVPDAFAETVPRLGGAGVETLWGLEVSVGVSWYPTSGRPEREAARAAPPTETPPAGGAGGS